MLLKNVKLNINLADGEGTTALLLAAPNEVFNSSPMRLISIPSCHVISAAKFE